nr:MAG TPA: hypothetical protein [Caudoviricetes sp.]DAS19671.1 MAG TPA: hypothetical protein [Caudoviricetes sp.]
MQIIYFPADLLYTRVHNGGGVQHGFCKRLYRLAKR